jgi:repressor LexA|tara:strand:+ start:2545 stop:3132 length:588 start_codon:yes stop_codon:yes gene_type:complete
MLTEKQHQTLEFIKEYISQFGYAPTTAEIALGISIKSRGVVHRYLKNLVSLNLIELVPGRKRNIKLKASNKLPLIGKIAAGLPIEAIEKTEEIDVLKFFVGEGRYALEVSGDSMIDEGIFDGDIVVCEECSNAANNTIVVALIDNEEATLKTIENNNNGYITLHPANEKHIPQVYKAERVRIQGIFIGLLRIAKR